MRKYGLFLFTLFTTFIPIQKTFAQEGISNDSQYRAGANTMAGVWLPSGDLKIIETTHFSTTKPVKHVAVNFPEFNFPVRLNGWVVVDFNIQPDGSVSDIKVIDTSGEPEYADEVLGAVSKWQYAPQSVDDNDVMAAGSAITTATKSIVQFDFVIGTMKQRTPPQLKSYIVNIDRLIEEGNLEEAKARLDNQPDWRIPNRYTQSLFHERYADYYKAIGDPLHRHSHLVQAYRQMTDFHGKRVKNIALDLMEASAAIGDFARVKAVYDAQFADNDNGYGELAKQKVEQVAAFEKQSTNASRQLLFNQYGHTFHLLRFRRFSIADIESEVTDVHVTCGNQITQLTMFEKDVATIPSTWGDCLVSLQGEPNTSLRLIEFNG